MTVKPMIETGDRGITLNKQLAWTMLVALVALVWYGGQTVAKLQGATDNLAVALTEQRQTAAEDRLNSSQIEARVRALEANASRSGAQLEAMSQSIEEMKASQRETIELLRRLVGQ